MMLRGYNPLREIAHWSLILFTLAGEATLANFCVYPMFNNLSMMDGEAWQTPFIITLLLFVMLLSIGIPSFQLIRSRREKQKMAHLRQAILKGNSQLLTTQPSL